MQGGENTSTEEGSGRNPNDVDCAPSEGSLSAGDSSANEVSDEPFEKLSYDTEIAQLKLIRYTAAISRWFRLILAGGRFYAKFGREDIRLLDWDRRRLPTVILRFWHFRPWREIRYQMGTGTVSIESDGTGKELPYAGLLNVRMREHALALRNNIRGKD